MVAGCATFTDTKKMGRHFLSGEWRVQANLESYLRSESGSALLGVIDLLSETVETTINNEGFSNGIESLKSMKRENS